MVMTRAPRKSSWPFGMSRGTSRAMENFLRLPLLGLLGLKRSIPRNARKIVAKAPRDRLSAVGPVNVIRAGSSEPLQRHCRSFQIEADGLGAESRERREISIVAILNRQILVIGRRNRPSRNALEISCAFSCRCHQAERSAESEPASAALRHSEEAAPRPCNKRACHPH